MLTLAEPGDPTPTWVEWKFRAHGESLRMARNGVDSGLSVTAHCICLVGRACSSVVPEWLRYGGAVDVKRAADLYAHGRTLRQISAALGVHSSTVGEQPLANWTSALRLSSPLIGDGLAMVPAHPDALVFSAFVANTAVHIGRVGAVLKVVPTSCG
jgi:hypothetical protein